MAGVDDLAVDCVTDCTTLCHWLGSVQFPASTSANVGRRPRASGSSLPARMTSHPSSTSPIGCCTDHVVPRVCGRQRHYTAARSSEWRALILRPTTSWSSWRATHVASVSCRTCWGYVHNLHTHLDSRRLDPKHSGVNNEQSAASYC